MHRCLSWAHPLACPLPAEGSSPPRGSRPVPGVRTEFGPLQGHRPLHLGDVSPASGKWEDFSWAGGHGESCSRPQKDVSMCVYNLGGSQTHNQPFLRRRTRCGGQQVSRMARPPLPQPPPAPAPGPASSSLLPGHLQAWCRSLAGSPHRALPWPLLVVCVVSPVWPSWPRGRNRGPCAKFMSSGLGQPAGGRGSPGGRAQGGSPDRAAVGAPRAPGLPRRAVSVTTCVRAESTEAVPVSHGQDRQGHRAPILLGEGDRRWPGSNLEV